jgi:hypothetical protein
MGPDGIYEYLGSELPLWEAEYAISPWGPERDDVNAWKIATWAGRQSSPPFSVFDQTREMPRSQPMEEAKANMERAASMWPGAKVKKDQ